MPGTADELMEGSRLAVELEAGEPDEAAERYAVAALAFARCGADSLRHQAKQRLRDIGLERPCWFCGRRVCGLGPRGVRSAAFVLMGPVSHDSDEVAGRASCGQPILTRPCEWALCWFDCNRRSA